MEKKMLRASERRLNIKMKMADAELHVHPFFGKNKLSDIVEAMNKNALDILGLESLDSSVYPYIVNETKRIYPESKIDSAGIKLPDEKCLLNAREYNTKEKFHILTIGYSMDNADRNTEIKEIIEKGLENNAIVILDHPFVDNVKTRTAGHISERMEESLEKLCKEYSGNIALEWNGYCLPWMRKWLMKGLNVFGFDIKYYDVNKKAEELSEKLRLEGYNVPVIADTDLHARNKKQLEEMGTSRILVSVEGECGKEVVSSMKKSIFMGNYRNIKEYVGSSHLLEAFCVPILIPKHFKKPRA